MLWASFSTIFCSFSTDWTNMSPGTQFILGYSPMLPKIASFPEKRVFLCYEGSVETKLLPHPKQRQGSGANFAHVEFSYSGHCVRFGEEHPSWPASSFLSCKTAPVFFYYFSMILCYGCYYISSHSLLWLKFLLCIFSANIYHVFT